MAWFLNGDWDCLTTPPGADVNDLPTIMSQIARAINERRAALNTAFPFIFPDLTPLQWLYTDALDVSAAYPTASNFAGARINGACVRRFLSDAEQAIDDICIYFYGQFGATLNDTPAWTASSLRAYASSGLGSFDLNRSATYAANWLIIRNSLNAMKIVRTDTGSFITENTITTQQRDSSDIDGGLEAALGFPGSATASEIYDVSPSISDTGGGDNMVGYVYNPERIKFIEQGLWERTLDLTGILPSTPFLKSAKNSVSTSTIVDGIVVNAYLSGDSSQPPVIPLDISGDWGFSFGGVSGSLSGLTINDSVSLSVPSSVLGASVSVITQFEGTSTPTEEVFTFGPPVTWPTGSYQISLAPYSPVIFWSIEPALTIA